MSRTAVLLLYVVPVLLSVVFLLNVGLVVPAVALLVVEAGVVSAVYLAKRPETPRPAKAPGVPRNGATVVVLLGVLVFGVFAGLLAVRAARGG